MEYLTANKKTPVSGPRKFSRGLSKIYGLDRVEPASIAYIAANVNAYYVTELQYC
jgi:hypothetical protein